MRRPVMVRSDLMSSFLMVLTTGTAILGANLASLGAQADRPVQPGRPAFEVASVKQNATGDLAGNFAVSPRFDVVAKATEGSKPSRQELFLMLQSLLVERFNLQARRETKLGPTYSLERFL
jgi:hypothetical protein